MNCVCERDQGVLGKTDLVSFESKMSHYEEAISGMWT